MIKKIFILLLICSAGGMATAQKGNVPTEKVKPEHEKVKPKHPGHGDHKSSKVEHAMDSMKRKMKAEQKGKGDTSGHKKPVPRSGENGKDQSGRPDSAVLQRGHAHGRDKTLTGREFGEERAREAQTRNAEKKVELDSNIVLAKSRAEQARTKIEQASKDLEKQKEKKQIDQKSYEAIKEKLQKAEKALQKLDQEIRNAEGLMDAGTTPSDEGSDTD